MASSTHMYSRCSFETKARIFEAIRRKNSMALLTRTKERFVCCLFRRPDLLADRVSHLSRGTGHPHSVWQRKDDGGVTEEAPARMRETRFLLNVDERQ